MPKGEAASEKVFVATALGMVTAEIVASIHKLPLNINDSCVYQVETPRPKPKELMASIGGDSSKLRKVTPVEIGPIPEAGPTQANDTDKAYLSKALTSPATHQFASTIPGDNLMTIVLSK